MGKALQKRQRVIAMKLIRLSPNEFSEDFEKNKQAVWRYLPELSKKERNHIAGYLVSAIKMRKHPKISSVQVGAQEERLKKKKRRK